MKGESKRRKKRTSGFRAPVSHSLDADSEEPTVVPRRLVPVSEESTVILYTTTKRQTEDVHDGRHLARKSPIKIVYRNKANRLRYNNDVVIFVKSQIVLNLVITVLERCKKE